MKNISDAATFRSFGAKARDCIRGMVARPILDSFWSAVESCESKIANIGERLACGRHAVERQHGLSNLEVPLSKLCGGESFHRFVAGMILDADRFVWELGAFSAQENKLAIETIELAYTYANREC